MVILNTLIQWIFFLVPIVGVIFPKGLVLLMFLICAIVLLNKNKHYSYRRIGIPNDILFLISVFMGWIFLTLLWSSLPKELLIQTFFSAIKTLIIVIFGVIYGGMMSNDGMNKKIIKSLTMGIIIGTIVFFLDGITSHKLIELTRINHKSHLSGITLLNKGKGIIVCLFWPCLSKMIKSGKRFKAICFFIFVAIMSFTGAKVDGGGTAACIAMIGGTLTFLIVYHLKNIGVFLITTGLVALIIIIPFLSYFFNHVDLEKTYHGLKLSIHHRACIWNYAMQKAKENNIFLGNGFDSSRHLNAQGVTFCEKSDTIPPNVFPTMSLHPHNFGVQLILETGVIGFIIFMIFICMIFRKISTINILNGKVDGNTMKKLFLIKAAAVASTVSLILLPLQSFGIWQSWLIGLTFFVYSSIRITISEFSGTKS